MFKLISVALFAGCFFESDQVFNNVSESEEAADTMEHHAESLFIPVRPVIPGWPCYYPTHIQCWTDWFDRDDPSGSGDWETLSKLRKEHPGKICSKPVGIEVQTLSGLSVAAAGDINTQSSPSLGFFCVNNNQPDKSCNDYRVRFVCHPPFCGGGVCWTKWYDRDNPSGTGDYEVLSHLIAQFPGQICAYPLYIEAVTTDTLTPAFSTGQVFSAFSPTQGLACRTVDQKYGMCRDYKVRFGCPCSY